MPLKSGSSREVVSQNIRTEMAHGKPQEQAVAIALKEAGLSNRDDAPMDEVGMDAAEAPIVMPAVPVLVTEHPQLHPDGSTPAEPALPLSRDGGFGQRDAAAGYGGVAGGAMESPFKGAADALPTSISLADICRTNEGFWPQFKGVE
jgi:hypothetical protein